MSGFAVRPFTASMASAATSTAEIDLGGHWQNKTLMIPAMGSGSAMHIQVSEESGGTFRRLHAGIANAVSAPNALIIASGTTNCFVRLPDFAAQYMKVELTTATTDTAYTFKVLCS